MLRALQSVREVIFGRVHTYLSLKAILSFLYLRCISEQTRRLILFPHPIFTQQTRKQMEIPETFLGSKCWYANDAWKDRSLLEAAE